MPMFLEGHDDEAPTLVARAERIEYGYQAEEWRRIMLSDYPTITNFRLYEGTLKNAYDYEPDAKLIGHWTVQNGQPVQAPISEVPTLQPYPDTAPADMKP